MTDLRTAELYGRLSELVVQSGSGKPGNYLLHADAQPAVVGYGIFEETDDRIQYRFAADDIPDLISDIWYAEDEDKRWSIMLLHVRETTFDAKLLYADDLDDPDEDDLDRRERMVREVLGDKPIVYPGPPADRAG